MINTKKENYILGTSQSNCWNLKLKGKIFNYIGNMVNKKTKITGNQNSVQEMLSFTNEYE